MATSAAAKMATGPETAAKAAKEEALDREDVWQTIHGKKEPCIPTSHNYESLKVSDGGCAGYVGLTRMSRGR
jgi:hypothetical protein